MRIHSEKNILIQKCNHCDIEKEWGPVVQLGTWIAINGYSDNGIYCWECMEQLLGRPLLATDLYPCPHNETYFRNGLAQKFNCEMPKSIANHSIELNPYPGAHPELKHLMKDK